MDCIVQNQISFQYNNIDDINSAINIKEIGDINGRLFTKTPYSQDTVISQCSSNTPHRKLNLANRNQLSENIFSVLWRKSNFF